MFGKAYLSMYEGSMVGAGPVRFAVWGYVIAKTYKSRVELNPKIIAPILGCEIGEVEDAIKWACSPDSESRNKEYGGARLVKEGQFQYFVPSWDHYHRMRSEDDRREYNRRKQSEGRARRKSAKANPIVESQQSVSVQFPNGDPKEIAIAKEIKGTETPRQQDADARRPMPETIREQWPPRGV